MSARNSVGTTGKVIDMKFPQKDKYLIFSNEKCFFGDGNFQCLITEGNQLKIWPGGGSCPVGLNAISS